jgi:hypothetical protein
MTAMTRQQTSPPGQGTEDAVATLGQATDQTAPTDKRIILFLDIDGVLHPAGQEKYVHGQAHEVSSGLVDPREAGMLCTMRQARLAALLQSRPYVDIVISSAWRTWHPQGDLEWLKKLLHPGIAARIVGATPDRTPAGIFATRAGVRRLEIQEFISNLDGAGRYGGWVALDDQPEHFMDTANSNVDFFYYEYAERLSRFRRTNLHSRRDEVVFVLAGEHGLTPGTARILGTAIDHAAGLVQPIPEFQSGMSTEFDVLLCIDLILEHLASHNMNAVSIPLSELSGSRRAVFERLGRWQLECTSVITIDAADLVRARSPGALRAAILRALGQPSARADAANFAKKLDAFGRQDGKHSVVAVIEGVEHLPEGAPRQRLLGWVDTVVGETLSHKSRQCGLHVLVLATTSTPRKGPVIGKCAELGGYRAFMMPDPRITPYSYDEAAGSAA